MLIMIETYFTQEFRKELERSDPVFPCYIRWNVYICQIHLESETRMEIGTASTQRRRQITIRQL